MPLIKNKIVTKIIQDCLVYVLTRIFQNAKPEFFKFQIFSIVYYNILFNVKINMTRKDAFLLFLAVGIVIGYTYALDTPQSLQIPLRKQPYNFSTAQFNLIYFATFLLIGFMQVPLGILIDRFSIKRTLIILLICLLISQTVISIMFEFRPSNYFIIILLMRSIFGLSGEGLFTVQCVVMSIYAESQYEVLAGMALALPFIFDAVNSATTTAVYDATLNLPLVWYIGVAVCIFSLICGIWMNKSIIGKENKQRISQQQQKQSKSCLKQVKELNPKLWVIVFFIFFTEASLGPFNDNLNELIVTRFNFSYTDAGKLLLIPFVALAFLTTGCGYLLRRKSTMRRISMLVSTTLYMVSHFMLYFLDNTKQPKTYHYLIVIFFLFCMSLNFAVYYASITTSIPFTVNSDILGTAWGCAGSAIGFSQCLVPLLIIYVINSHTDLGVAYRNLNFMGILLSIIPVLFSMWINYKQQYDILDVHYTDSQQHLSQKGTASTKQDDLHSNLSQYFLSQQVNIDVEQTSNLEIKA